MNKKGFTILELLGAIVILGILSVMAIVGVSNLIQKSKMTDEEQYEKTLKQAAQSYMQSNKNRLPKAIGEQRMVTATELKENNYLKEGDKGCVEVYKKDKNKYVYTVNMECQEKYIEEICKNVGPKIEKMYFTDHTLSELETVDLDNLEEARMYIYFKGGTKAGKELGIESYSYSISVQTKNDPNLHEVYNSGSLNGNGNKEIKIIRKISEYVHLSGATNVVVTLKVKNTEGCPLKKSISTKYEDDVKPICTFIKNQATSGNDWINKKDGGATRTITATCDDGLGSGCVSPTFSRTWENDYQHDAEWAYIQVKDNAGNTNIDDEFIKATPTLCGNSAQVDNSCRVRVNVDKTLPTIKVVGAYERANGTTATIKKGAPNILNINGSGTITIDNNSNGGHGTGSIAVGQYKNLINDWMNLKNYEYGVAYQVEISDTLHLAGWSWKTNPGGVSHRDTEYGTLGNNESPSGKNYEDIQNNDCGKLNDTIIIGFSQEGRRKGELKVWDKANNVTTLTIYANLDRTAPEKPTVTYKKAKSNANYTAGTARANWSTELINSYVTAKVEPDISGWDRFEYWYRKQNAVNNTEATTAGSLAAAITGQTKMNNYPDKIENLAGYQIKDEGRHLFKYNSCDRASNCSDYSNEDTIKIDTKPPICSNEISYPNGNPTSYGWLGKHYANSTTYTSSGKNTAIVKQVCTEDGTYGSQCDLDTISQFEYNVPINTTAAGAEGDGKGGTIADKAGNVKSCTPDQTVRIDYQEPKCVETNQAEQKSNGDWIWTRSRTIYRKCEDYKEKTTDMISGCVPKTESISFGGKNADVNLNDKLKTNHTFPGFGIQDKAGNRKLCGDKVVHVYVDRSAPNCDYKKTNKYSKEGVTIEYTCDDLYKGTEGTGVKTCPGGSDHIVTKRTTTQTPSMDDKLENDATCTVPVYSQKQYKKKTRTWNSCKYKKTEYYDCIWRGGNNPSNATVSTCVGHGSCTSSKRGTVCGSPNATYGWTCVCSSRKVCVGDWNDWSGWSSSWSTDNHCPNYKDSNSCDQKSRIVYY